MENVCEIGDFENSHYVHIMRKNVEIVRTSTVYWTVNKVKL